MHLGRLCTGFVLTAALAGAALAPAVAATPVLVKQCFVTQPKPLSKTASGTQIDYIIYGKKAASQITFAVGYRNAAQHFLRTVTDYGSFSPGTQINHHFSLYNDVTYAGHQVSSCVPVKVKWADSTLWVAPSSH
ncbi:MAG TPA: hypothetical protein VJP76_08235 [Candidatus Tumulicola sp.]|nr:hypothetical protein [Candidatus Tumulicola sp.]